MIRVNETLCTACGICLSACPQSAISLFGRRVDIDAQRCDGCEELALNQERSCIETCPQQALFWGEVVSLSNSAIVTQPPVKNIRHEEHTTSCKESVFSTVGNALKSIGKEMIRELPNIITTVANSPQTKRGDGCRGRGGGRGRHRRWSGRV